jgi:hypothetical protein
VDRKIAHSGEAAPSRQLQAKASQSFCIVPRKEGALSLRIGVKKQGWDTAAVCIEIRGFPTLAEKRRQGWGTLGSRHVPPLEHRALAVPVLNSGEKCVLVAPANLGQQPENFEVEPDQRHHQSECAVPIHVFRRAHAHAALDEVKIENQIERRDDHHNEAEPDADQTRAVRGNKMHSEKSQHKLSDIKQHDRAGGGDHSHAEILRHLDQPER